MNRLSRALAQLVSSHSASRRRALAHPLFILHKSSSSLYSTTTAASSFRWHASREQKPELSSSALSQWSVNQRDLKREKEKTEAEAEVGEAKGARISGDWPRPSEIPWQAKVANSVNLIGTVLDKVQFQSSRDGKSYACTVISQNATSDCPRVWVPIMFEGDLAHVAACHLKENDYVYIVGQLSADPSPFAGRESTANIQVMVHNINFVHLSPPKKKSVAVQTQEQHASNHSDSTTNDEDSALNYWKDLFDNPKEWLDYRASKHDGLVKPRHPDFKCNDGKALWLDDAPEWVSSKLDEPEFKSQIRKVKLVKARQGLWNNLVENPDKWWDNRLTKAKEKSPDFKHKDTGVGLWLTDVPAGILSKLPPVKANEDVATSSLEDKHDHVK